MNVKDRRKTRKKHLKSFVFKDIILGGQDGLVNILALVLGVAAATSSQKVVIVAGLAALFAESISMGAVAYTSSKSALDYYKNILKSKQKLLFRAYENPVKSGFIVGFASVGGSLIPLFSFFFLPIKQSIYLAFFLSITALFITGTIKAKLTNQKWFKCGLELAIIGTLAAVAGYLIGFGLEKIFF